MAKHTLTLEEDLNFDLIGICSHYGDYRVCWSINKQLGLQLVKSPESFMVSGKKGAIISSHSLYEWEDEVESISYYLIQNKCDGKFLLPEKSQVDFILVIKEADIVDVNFILGELKKIPDIITALELKPKTLKSAKKIIF